MRMFRSATAGVALLSLAVLPGCVTDDMGQKQTVGTLLGAAAGGLLGSQLGGGKGQMVAIAAGTLAGAWLGSEIGKSLDEADRLAIQQESARALASAKDGETVAWNNPDSGASARITPVSTRHAAQVTKVPRRAEVEPVQRMTLIGETYTAIKNANVRSGPGAGYAVAASLQQGEAFHAVGRVEGSDWIMVARGGTSIGYVYGPLVERASAPEAQPAPVLRQAVNLDEMDDGENVVVDEVVAETECRTLDYKVQAGDGRSEQKTFDACKSADGAWEII